MTRSRFITALLVLNVLASFALTLYGWTKPVGNWDIIAYTALAIREPGMGDAELSRRAHEDVLVRLGEPAYREMMKANDPYASRVEAQPAALRDVLRFYEVKPLYAWAARALRPLTGGNGAHAAALVSALGLALLVSVMPWFFRGREAVVLAMLWILMLLAWPPWWPAGSVASPDTLALFFATCAALFAIARWRPVFAVAAAALSVLARPDCAFLVVPLLAGLAWIEWRATQQRARALPWLVGAAGVFALFVVLGRSALPWSTLFWNTFIAREPFPSAIHYHVDAATYFNVIWRNLPRVFYWRPLAFLALAFALGAASIARTRRLTLVSLFAACAVLNALLHYAVFPAAEFPFDRMFFASYPIVIAALALWLDERRANDAQATPAA